MSVLTDRIDNLMYIKGINRAGLCREINLPESTYRMWIKGSLPNIEAAYKVAQYFDVSMEFLLTGKDKDKRNEFYLTDEEKQLIDVFRELDKSKKADLINIAAVLKNK